MVNLKDEFIYEYKDINYLFALNFEHTSFTPEDSIKLEKFRDKKGEGEN